MSKRAYLAPISWGLGDLIVSLPAIHALIDAGWETYLVVRSQLQDGLGDRIEGLAGCIQESQLAEVFASNPSAKLFNLRDHPIQTEYWWGSPEFEAKYGKLTIDEILSRICNDFGISADFRSLRPMRSYAVSSAQNKVVLLPGSDGTYKCWGKDNWLELAAALNSEGLPPILVGQPQHSREVTALMDTGLKWLPTPTLADALDVISSCRMVIGVDTGLTHAAVQQGIPTITLYRHNPIYVRHHPHVSPLIANPCIARCLDKSLGPSIAHTGKDFTSFSPRSWECEAAGAERCMNSITPAMVLGRIPSLKF